MNFLELKEKIIQIIFPTYCLSCQREGQILCDDCFSLLEINPWQYCPFCSNPQKVIDNGKCSRHQNFYLDGLFSAVAYQDQRIKKIIQAFKYGPYLKNLDTQLIKIIIAHFMLSENKILIHSQNQSCFISVPIFKSKMKKRGYNQSHLIANGLSQHFKIPLVEKALIRVKNTSSQVKLSRDERKINIKEAFSITNAEPIKNKTIFLVDDVFTTGATLEECAKTLKKTGAKKVYGIVVAREGLNQN